MYQNNIAELKLVNRLDENYLFSDYLVMFSDF